MKYRGKISGPIMDRIDIQKEVYPVSFFHMDESQKVRTSAELKEKVKAARTMQQKRYTGEDGVNPRMPQYFYIIEDY